MPFCRYKNILGIPGQGSHSYRIFNIAIFDVIGTLIIAYIFTKIFDVPLWFAFIFWFVIGIFLHKIFCVDTTINKLLF